jgi:hypothetical protein
MNQPPQWPDLSGSPTSEQPAAPLPDLSPPPAAPPVVPPAAPPVVPPAAIPAQPLYPGASYGTPSGHPHTYGYAHQAYPYQPQQRTNGLAIASMVLSISGGVLLFCVYFLGGVPGAVGAILGHVARKKVRERGEAGDGMALAGIIVGWIVTGLALLILIVFVALFVFAMSIPFADPVNF